MDTQDTVASAGPAAAEAPKAAEAATEDTASRRRGSGAGLSSMVLPELQAMATSLGITGTGRMRKSQLVEAIQQKQGGGKSAGGPIGLPRLRVRLQPRRVPSVPTS